MGESYVCNTFEKKKYDFTSALISEDWYIKRMAFNWTFEYTTAVKRYHSFKTIWQPKENGVLVCQFENGNNYDMFATNTCDQRRAMVDHLSREVSRITKFIMIVVQQYLLCLPEHIIVDGLLSRVGWRSHAKYQLPYPGPA